jgi:hypothetical protein
MTKRFMIVVKTDKNSEAGTMPSAVVPGFSLPLGSHSISIGLSQSGHSRWVHVCIHRWEGRPAGSPLQSRRAYLDEAHDGAKHVRCDLGISRAAVGLPTTENSMMVRWLFAALHLLALGIGLGAVWARGRGLQGELDETGLQRVFYTDTWWA